MLPREALVGAFLVFLALLLTQISSTSSESRVEKDPKIILECTILNGENKVVQWGNRIFSTNFYYNPNNGPVGFVERVEYYHTNSILKRKMFLQSDSYLDCLSFPFLFAAMFPFRRRKDEDEQTELIRKSEILNQLMPVMQYFYIRERPIEYLISINPLTNNRNASVYLLLLLIMYAETADESKLKLISSIVVALLNRCVIRYAEFYDLRKELSTYLSEKFGRIITSSVELKQPPTTSCIDTFTIQLIYHEFLIKTPKSNFLQLLKESISSKYGQNLKYFSNFYQQELFRLLTRLHFSVEQRDTTNAKFYFAWLIQLTCKFSRVSYDQFGLISFGQLLEYLKTVIDTIDIIKLDEITKEECAKIELLIIRLMEFSYIRFKIEVANKGDGQVSGEWKEQCEKYFTIISRIQRIKESANEKYWKMDRKSIKIEEGRDVFYFESLIFDTEAGLKEYRAPLPTKHWTGILKYIQEFQVIISPEEDSSNNSFEPQPQIKKQKFSTDSEKASSIVNWLEKSPFSTDQLCWKCGNLTYVELAQFITAYHNLLKQNPSNDMINQFFVENSTFFSLSKPNDTWNSIWTNLNQEEQLNFLRIYVNHLIQYYNMLGN